MIKKQQWEIDKEKKFFGKRGFGSLKNREDELFTLLGESHHHGNQAWVIIFEKL